MHTRRFHSVPWSTPIVICICLAMAGSALAQAQTQAPEEPLSPDFHTYILLANPQTTAANVTVTFLREDGAPPVTQDYVVEPSSRRTIDTRDVPELNGRAFGARIAVMNGMPILVERSMYWSANGVFWAGGSNGGGVLVP